jgi:penicillin amidase
MSRSRLGSAGALLALAVTGYLGTRPVGPLPALGPLLDPANGLWASVRSAELEPLAAAAIAGLTDSVSITYDDRGVPHIFAGNTLDAYRALGFVVARDRRFQIEMSSRAGAGTLTELVGARALPLDRATRALGMPRAAELRIARADTTTQSWRMATAYADGINAWTRSLSSRAFPLEYKLLGREPSAYGPLDIMHLFNRMGYTLASSDDELRHLRAAARVGDAAARALFAPHAPIVEPIQPNGLRAPRRDSVPLPPPGAPDQAARELASALPPQALGLPDRQPDAVGSNNWAVAPARSASGNALLAGDPHLELTLPSIWYEVHLVVADTFDVYGVTIPGLPGVVIGFTPDVAWTFTNVGADVMDFYAETVDDPVSPTQYRLDDEWVRLERRVERFFDANGDLLAEDTMRYTHRGPLRRLGARWISHRWTVLESDGREMEVFHDAARAGSTRELLDAMALRYEAPAQNMLAADRAGVIGIRSTGRYPIRPDSGRGDILRDGSTRTSDWLGDWRVAEYPQAVAPAQGYLASANQQPMDPRTEPRYMGSDWERPWRAIRINELLRQTELATPDTFAAWQTDPGSARANTFVPAFVAAARNAPPKPSLVRAAQWLADWERRYTPENERAVLFEAAMSELAERLWDELLDDTDDAMPPGPTPSDMMTALLLERPTSVWWDQRATAAVETRDEILSDALEAAWEALIAQHGEPDAGGWAWARHRTATINHLLRIPSMGRAGIPIQGGPGLLNPSSGAGTHGASWRMVVELGNEVRALGTYPGGQSGHPASTRYADRITRWTEGRLDTLRTPRTPSDLPPEKRRALLVLRPEAP